VSSNRPESEDYLDAPFAVWLEGNETDVRYYYDWNARRAAQQRARDDRDLAYAWPVTYCARDGVTGQIWKVRIDRVMQPAFVALDAIEIPMPPTVHVLWGGDVLCEDPRLRRLKVPGNWPEGQRWISLKDVAGGVQAPVDRCEKCWAKAPAIVAELRQIGSDR